MSSSGGWIRRGSRLFPTPTSQAINARLAAVGYPGSPITTGVYPNPVDTTHFLGEDRSSDQQSRSVRRPVQPLRRGLEQLARRGRTERSDGLVRAGQRRSVVCVQQHADAVIEDGQRDPRAVRVRQSQGAAERSDRAGCQYRRRGVLWHARRAARMGAGTRCIKWSTTYRIRRAPTR